MGVWFDSMANYSNDCVNTGCYDLIALTCDSLSKRK